MSPRHLIHVPPLTLTQEAVLRELLAAGGEMEFAGRKLATARELWKKKQLVKLVAGKEPLGKWFTFTQHGREVAEWLPTPAEG